MALFRFLVRPAARALIAFVALGAGGAAAASGWTLVDIGTLGGPGSYATAVSSSGYVVGCSDVMPSGIHAFLYRDGKLTDLDAGSEPGHGNSCALAVNEFGDAAGRSGGGELVVWKQGAKTGLGVTGNVGGLNDAGVVVGSYASGTTPHAFVWEGGRLVDLAAVAGFDAALPSAANAVNTRGDVAGVANGHAFLYRNGVAQDLGTLGGNASVAKAINDRGQVVGMAGDANAQPTAFLYDGTMRAIPGPGFAAAVGISNAGDVVASAEGLHGYVIDGGKATRLDTLAAVRAPGWRHVEPTGINDRGWIVGTAYNAQGDPRAFLLIPRN